MMKYEATTTARNPRITAQGYSYMISKAAAGKNCAIAALITKPITSTMPIAAL